MCSHPLGCFIVIDDAKAMNLTQKMLDANGVMTEYRCVKTRFSVWLVAGAVALTAMVACKPQAPDMERLSALQRNNAELRKEIARMHALIRQAGADTPDLQQQIDRRNSEVVAAYKQMEALREKETELKMRRIELESRLDSFRDTFTRLQNEIAVQNIQP